MLRYIEIVYPNKTLHKATVYSVRKTEDGKHIMMYYLPEEKGKTFLKDDYSSIIFFEGKWYREAVRLSKKNLKLIYDKEYSDNFLKNEIQENYRMQSLTPSLMKQIISDKEKKQALDTTVNEIIEKETEEVKIVDTKDKEDEYQADDDIELIPESILESSIMPNKFFLIKPLLLNIIQEILEKEQKILLEHENNLEEEQIVYLEEDSEKLKKILNETKKEQKQYLENVEKIELISIKNSNDYKANSKVFVVLMNKSIDKQPIHIFVNLDNLFEDNQELLKEIKQLTNNDNIKHATRYINNKVFHMDLSSFYLNDNELYNLLNTTSYLCTVINNPLSSSVESLKSAFLSESILIGLKNDNKTLWSNDIKISDEKESKNVIYKAKRLTR